MRNALRSLAAAALTVLLLTGAKGGCQPEGSGGASGKPKGPVAVPTYGAPSPNPDHGAPDRRRQPQPLADPSALAKVGNDNHSGILHVDWDGNVSFRITYSDGYGRKVIPEFRPQYGQHGGRVDIPFVVTEPVNVYIIGEPTSPRDRNRTWEDWEVWCSIKWGGQIVDTDNADAHGGVRCDAAVHP